MIQENNSGKYPFNFDNLYDIKGLSSPRPSPDNRFLVCIVTIPDKNENARKDYVTLISLTEKTLKYITEGSSPLWSPDGLQIAYESSEDGLSGIFIYNLKNETKRFVTPVYHSSYFINHLEQKNFAWSPNGEYIAFVSAAAYSDSTKEENDVKVINRLLYKTKGGRGRPYFSDDCLTHIWIVDAKTTGAKAEIITSGNYNEHSLSWSPDSSEIAFISNRSVNPDNNQYDDLWTVDIKTKSVTKLTSDFGTAFQPSWSPDGKHIAFLATKNSVSTNDSPSEDTHIYLIASSGGMLRCLTKKLDRRIENISWHFNSQLIYFTAGDRGTTPLFRVSLATEIIESIIEGNFQILEYALVNNTDSIVYTRSDINHPAEVFIMEENRQSIIRLTHENEHLLNKTLVQDAETFWFNSFDGSSVQGWLMKPVLFRNSDTYPLVLVIHGGPHNMFGYSFEERMQLLCANGYGVLFINPRGSSGYGQAFSSGCVLNWGGGDFKDVMAGLDYVINKNRWIDEERLCVTGQSYGGYLTNWIITQTDRFKAAVVDGGISNLISFSGTSLYHSLIESEFNGNAYDNYPLLWQWSPLRNVKNVKTPTLFLHGELDNEVPVSQAEEMYVALKKLDVKTSFVQYIGEGHGWRPDLKPANRVDLYERMVDWFGQVMDKKALANNPKSL